MTNENKSPTAAVALAFGLWALAFGLSLYLAATTVPDGDGFTRGMNRIGTFFRWQFLAFALALVTWMTARGRPDLSRWQLLMARTPIAIQCLLGLAGVIVVVLALVLD